MDSTSNGTPVGRVVGLWRYPVKSMGAEALTQVEVSWHGLAGDRRWAFVRNGETKSGFPWLTLRERGNMSHYTPSFVDPARPDKSATVVLTPAGVLLDVTDPALAEELHPSGARPLKCDRGVFDTFPLSLITTQTIDRLAQTVGMPLEVQRFRPNILVEAIGEADFPEDRWVGRVLRVGSLRLRVDKRDGRCVVITIDPVTTQRTPTILRAVASERQGCLGVYGSTVEPGSIALGDLVVVEALA
jgi:uncharacterized protein